MSRFFYKRLNNSELKDEHIEIHSQTGISKNKFKGEYDFHDNIDILNDRLGYKKETKRGTTPDFIITKEDYLHSLWLVGEVKYFRTWQWKDRVEKDVKELNLLKDLKICEKTVYFVADDFLHENNENEWSDLLKRLKEERERKNLDYVDFMIMCHKKTINATTPLATMNKDYCKQNDFNFDNYCDNNK